MMRQQSISKLQIEALSLVEGSSNILRPQTAYPPSQVIHPDHPTAYK